MLLGRFQEAVFRSRKEEGMKHCKFLVSGFCILGLASSVFGQTRVFYEEQGGNPVATPPGGSIIVTTAGATHTIDVWVEDVNFPERLNGVQASVPCVIACSGGGTATFVGGSESLTDPSNPQFCFNGRFCGSGGEVGTQCTANNVTECPGATNPPGICPPGQSSLPVQDPGTCPVPFATAGEPRVAVAHGTTQPGIVLEDDGPFPPGGTFNGGICTFGTVQYVLSPDAKGDCVILLENEPGTAVRNQSDMPVPFTTDPITLRIPVFKCCQGTVCLGEGYTAGECQAAGGTLGNDNDCDTPCACLSNADCNDNNGCTNNVCQAGTCVFPSNVPPGSCCNPAGGVLTPINDGNECTADNCDSGTGAVTHPPVADGTVCTEDGNVCTLDACTAGACVSTPIPDCVASPDLTVDCADGEKPNPECFQEGDKVTLTVNIGAGTQIINGGQFRLVYDPSCLDFLSIAPGAACDEGSPYEVEIFEQINEAAGTIFYAAGINLIQNGGSNAGGTLACLSFAKIGACTSCNVCFDDLNPQHTYLSGPGGALVLPTLPNDGCGCDVQTNGVTTVTVPEGGAFNADCDSPTAIVTWASPAAASDTCDGPLDMVCTCSHTNPLVTDCSNLIAHGGEFPQGTAEFECCATDSCGVETCDSWTVFVSDETTLDLVLQLSPTMDPDQFTRCIEFGFYANCVEAPEIFKEELVFGPPWDFPGHATYDIKVPKGQYACITARDQVHTLRSVADIECGSNGHLSAEFKGDPFFGGNWLIGGNLDGSHVIDILDFGVLVSQYLKPGDVNNTCDEIKAPGYRDADINADGVVDSLDYAFIQGNFLEEDKDSCCPDGDGGVAGGPVYTSVTVQQLREMGKADLAVADLNRDGVLDGADMEAFQAGVVPAPARHAPKSSR